MGVLKTWGGFCLVEEIVFYECSVLSHVKFICPYCRLRILVILCYCLWELRDFSRNTTNKKEISNMGSVCCCLHVEDFEEYLHPNSSIYRRCICLRCFIQQFVTAVCFEVVNSLCYFILESCVSWNYLIGACIILACLEKGRD